jgi:transposase
MKYITGESRYQKTFLPDCIEDYVGEDNPVRVIDAFVDQLDMEELGFKRSRPNDTGRPSCTYMAISTESVPVGN